MGAALFHGHTEIVDLLERHGARKTDGVSARQKIHDEIADGFQHVNAMKNLMRLIDESKKKP